MRVIERLGLLATFLVLACQSIAAAQVANSAPPGEARAAMLIATPDDPQHPVASLGSTVWSLIPAAANQPATVAVKAEADIPDLKMHATMTLRKNTDPSLQATHTIDLKFSFAKRAPITGFKDVGVPQMRMEDSAAAEALTSVKVKISDTYFLIGLAKGDSDDTARNLDLMETRAWFDFPLLLNDDRIAKIVFQKSTKGQAMLARALNVWNSETSPPPTAESTAISLEPEGGTFVVPVLINDAITLKFTVDSGAADVSIPADVVMTLIRTGTLLDNDFLGSQTYVLADGTKVPSQTFRIRTLKVGDRILENVTGSIAPIAGNLLLGQSFLSHFKSWSIDNQRQVLILN